MELTDKYYRQDLCEDVGRCKLYHPLFEQGQCEYYNQWCELKQKNKQLREKLAIKDRMIMLILKNTYYLDKEYFIEETPTQDEYIVSQTKYWTKQAKEEKEK